MARTVPRAVGKGIGVAMHGPPSFLLSSNYPPPLSCLLQSLEGKGQRGISEFSRGAGVHGGAHQVKWLAT